MADSPQTDSRQMPDRDANVSVTDQALSLVNSFPNSYRSLDTHSLQLQLIVHPKHLILPSTFNIAMARSVEAKQRAQDKYRKNPDPE